MSRSASPMQRTPGSSHGPTVGILIDLEDHSNHTRTSPVHSAHVNAPDLARGFSSSAASDSEEQTLKENHSSRLLTNAQMALKDLSVSEGSRGGKKHTQAIKSTNDIWPKRTMEPPARRADSGASLQKKRADSIPAPSNAAALWPTETPPNQPKPLAYMVRARRTVLSPESRDPPTGNKVIPQWDANPPQPASTSTQDRQSVDTETGIDSRLRGAAGFQALAAHSKNQYTEQSNSKDGKTSFAGTFYVPSSPRKGFTHNTATRSGMDSATTAGSVQAGPEHRTHQKQLNKNPTPSQSATWMLQKQSQALNASVSASPPAAGHKTPLVISTPHTNAPAVPLGTTQQSLSSAQSPVLSSNTPPPDVQPQDNDALIPLEGSKLTSFQRQTKLPPHLHDETMTISSPVASSTPQLSSSPFTLLCNDEIMATEPLINLEPTISSSASIVGHTFSASHSLLEFLDLPPPQELIQLTEGFEVPLSPSVVTSPNLEDLRGLEFPSVKGKGKGNGWFD
ncbi:hypothetical protein BDZ91DRAFT_782640 [Kalaharituber pfeilii]|nr:hypothetical protein BDZ91DRAFT_782640 [Kalaharituber pfeilii]